MVISVDEAFHLLLEGKEIVVRPYGDDGDDFVGVDITEIVAIGYNPSITKLTEDEITTIISYLEEKDDLEYWEDL